MKSAERGLEVGTAECGNIFGFIGVTKICSDQEASRDGLIRGLTSTFS
jgi:hypothetical protein